MNSVKWGEYRLCDLFESENGDFDIQKHHINGDGNFVVTAGIVNNGILGKTDIHSRIFKPNSITVDMFGNVFYRNYEYKMVTHARVFSLSFKSSKIESRAGVFIASILEKTLNSFGYENMCSWAKIKNLRISLPQTENGEIDFAFMEDFVAELEAQRVAELEAQRVAELEAYLSVTGLNDYTLTKDEQNAVDGFNSVEWGSFKNTDLFNLQPITQMLSKKDFVSSGEYPVYSSISTDGGVLGYTNSPNYICDKDNPIYITFGDHTRTFNIAKKSFSILDNVKVLKPNTDNLNVLLFMITSWHKNIPNLGYSRHWKIARESYLSLPQTENGEIDFAFMETFISAIQKLVIKGVVEYKDNLIKATKDVIK